MLPSSPGAAESLSPLSFNDKSLVANVRAEDRLEKIFHAKAQVVEIVVAAQVGILNFGQAA